MVVIRLSSPAIALSLVGLILGGIWFGTISLPAEDDFILGSGRLSAVEFIRQMTASDDCVVTDDARIALLAKRPIPPRLSETSHTRIGAGWLSSAVVLQAISDYSCPIVVMGPRFSNLPDLTEEVESRYSVKLLFADVDGSNTITVYVGQRNPAK